MISPYQAPLLISSYDKAMESFVRLAQFDLAADINFECEVDNFRIPLAHDDLVTLSLMLRRMLEICGLVDRARNAMIHHHGQAFSVHKLISRVFHSIELETHSETITLEVRTMSDAVKYYLDNAHKSINIDPIVSLKSEKDGYTEFKLREFLRQVDGIICEAVEVAVSHRIYLERSVR